MQDLITQLTDKIAMLESAIKELGKRGRAYAEAERDYRVALAQKTLAERDKGMPVTIISDICRGDPVIAKAKFERDVTEVMYKSALEAVQGYKLQIRILDAQLDREWHSG